VSSVLRLVRFNAVGAGFDAALRAALAPALAGVPGLRTAVAGRIGPGEDGERLLVSVWDDEDALRAAVRSSTAAALAHPGWLHGTPAGPADVLPVAIEVEPALDAAISIVRVLSGTTKPGELGAYTANAREGTLRDRAAGEGALALYLGAEPPCRFVTVSLWGRWSHVETATGADHEHVDRTRHAERLATWTAEHYEVIPGLAMVRPAGTATLPDEVAG
jgi:hypothetical protein